MNASFGMARAPSSSGPDGDPLSSSSESKSPLPLFSAAFSLPSANFTFQGIPSRPPSSDFSVGGPSCFPFPNGPSPAVAPPASLARPQPGFTVRGPYGNTLTPSTSTNTQPPVSGQNPRIFMRPFSSTAMRASTSGVQSAQVQPVHEVGPTPHIPGTAPALPPSRLQATGVSSQIGAMPSARPGVLLPTSMLLHPRTAAIAASRVSSCCFDEDGNVADPGRELQTSSVHKLHERMKPWIEKKIVEFLGEEEPTLVDYIVSNTRKHASAAEMLDLLTTILDDEAELFVMKLWRMLIFEVKKIEAGLSKPNL